MTFQSALLTHQSNSFTAGSVLSSPALNRALAKQHNQQSWHRPLKGSAGEVLPPRPPAQRRGMGQCGEEKISSCCHLFTSRAHNHPQAAATGALQGGRIFLSHSPWSLEEKGRLKSSGLGETKLSRYLTFEKKSATCGLFTEIQT